MILLVALAVKRNTKLGHFDILETFIQASWQGTLHMELSLPNKDLNRKEVKRNDS